MTWDSIVIGGGASGLSAGLVLGRARRRTLIIDKGEPSNRFAHGIGGLLGQDGRPPAGFYADAREELEKHPTVEQRQGEVTDGAPGFTLTLADGTTETATTVLLATGMDYEYPDFPGVQERWGQTAFHCPFCHGWEVREKPLFVLDAGEHGPMRVQLLKGWSDDVTLITETPQELRDEEIVLADGSTHPCGGLLMAVRLHQRSDLARRLGAEPDEPSPVAQDPLKLDLFQTTTAGVFAAGDIAVPNPSVANAIAAGSNAAAMVVHRLLLDH
jgi:thioredoxin reductase